MSEHKKLYATARWEKLRAHQLSREPLCAFCLQQNIITPATVVDHVVPHRGDNDLFYNSSNLQSMCKYHHDSEKQAIEKRGYSNRISEDGWPVDKSHPFYGVAPKTFQ